MWHESGCFHQKFYCHRVEVLSWLAIRSSSAAVKVFAELQQSGLLAVHGENSGGGLIVEFTENIRRINIRASQPILKLIEPPVEFGGNPVIPRLLRPAVLLASPNLTPTQKLITWSAIWRGDVRGKTFRVAYGEMSRLLGIDRSNVRKAIVQSVDDSTPLRLELREFLECLEDGPEPLISWSNRLFSEQQKNELRWLSRSNALVAKSLLDMIYPGSSEVFGESVSPRLAEATYDLPRLSHVPADSPGQSEVFEASVSPRVPKNLHVSPRSEVKDAPVSPRTEVKEAPVLPRSSSTILPAMLSAAVEKIREKMGVERFDVWFSNHRFELDHDRLKIIVGNTFDAERVKKHSAELRTAIDMVDGVKHFEVVVDSVLQTSQKDSPQKTAQQPTVCYLNSLKSSDNKPNQPNRCADAALSLGLGEAREEQPTNQQVLDRAATIYKTIDDSSCYRWVTILASCAVELGWETEADMLALSEACAGLGTFNTELKALLTAKHRWPRLIEVKRLAKQCGVRWERRFQRSVDQDRAARSKDS
jgi:hypothetical protein